MDGFLLVDKPKDMTSHDVVLYLKRKFHFKKIGHTGTLDPFASGLLIICVGKATKLSDMFMNMNKSYDGTLVFNKHYDTYDVTGKLIEEKEMQISEEALENAVKNMIKAYDQLPPMYSAIKVDGQKLYELARAGKEIERDKRPVEIYDFKLTSSLVDHTVDFSIDVSKGTYIRSIAVDLADSLHTYGALKELRRTKIGPYRIEQAKPLHDIIESDMITLEAYFIHHPRVVLNDYMIKLVRNGVYLDERQTTIDKDFIVYDEQGHMIAFYQRIKEHTYKPGLIF
jgi:tRNA pseudouridine55 synthase